MRNIELKARCDDLDRAARQAEAVGATFAGVLEQTDTYFVVPRGRLKLRQTTGKPAELIVYAREDSVSFRPSEYQLIKVAQPEEMKAMLREVLDVRCEVRKRRRLYLWENVRIHLDAVEGLGAFIEFEAVIGMPDQESNAHEQLDRLAQALSIKPIERVACSYADLIADLR